MLFMWDENRLVVREDGRWRREHIFCDSCGEAEGDGGDLACASFSLSFSSSCLTLFFSPAAVGVNT